MNGQRSRGRLIGWLSFVGIFATLQYSAYFTLDEDERVPKDFLYRYSAAVFGVIQFAVMLGIVLLISIGLPKRPLFGLRRPSSWKLATGLGVLVLVGVYVLSGLLSLWLDPSGEQGLLPDRWRPDRAGAYATNFVVVVGLVPIVEELIFRGLGFTLLRRFGDGVAIVGTGVLFAMTHGLVEAFPVIAVFGIGLAFVRARTGSVYPGMIVHGIFNTVAMLAVFAQPS